MERFNALQKVQKKKINFSQKQNHTPYYLHKLRKAILALGLDMKRGGKNVQVASPQLTLW